MHTAFEKDGMEGGDGIILKGAAPRLRLINTVWPKMPHDSVRKGGTEIAPGAKNRTLKQMLTEDGEYFLGF